MTLYKISLIFLLVQLLAACGGGDSQNADPTVNAQPIAYVKRPVPVDQNNIPISNDYRDPSSFNPGANIYLKSNATVGASETNITGALLGTTGDVKDVEFSSDGSKLVFALQLEDPNPNDDIEMTWDIYTYDIGTGVLAPVIASEVERRVGNDVMPHFVPDGNDPTARIVFSSDRGQDVTEILNAEGKPKFKIQTDDRQVYAYNLHMIDADGQNLRQITFNMSHDFDPVMLQDGRIMFVRLDDSRSGVEFNSNGRYSLYTVHPDGTNVQLLYGFDSQNTGTNNSRAVLTSPRMLSDGRVVAILRDFTDTFDGGDVVVVDANNYIDTTIPFDATSGLTGPGQSSASNTSVVLTNAGLSEGGRYSAAVPMLDSSNRAVVSYSLCFAEVTNPDMTVDTVSCGLVPDLTAANVQPAPPRYGIYMYDLSGGTINLIRNAEPGFYYTDIAVAQDLSSPAVLPNITTQATIQAGILNIKSVYDMDGVFNDLDAGIDVTTFSDLMSVTMPESRRPRFIRIVKGVYFPNNDDIANFDFDPDGFGLGVNYMREIIGYAPVHPDGSVRVQVPANVPLSFEIVNANAQRIDVPNTGQEYSHPTWLVVRPDEEVTCHGCHAPASTRVHGRSYATLTPGTTMDGLGANAMGTFAYPGIISIPAAVGATMAEARTNLAPFELPVDTDLEYTDYWTGSGNSFTYSYANLQTVMDSINANPMSAACGGAFDPECRIVYRYASHIQPIWEVARTAGGKSTQCIRCHTNADLNQIPFGQRQLDLTQDGTGDPVTNAFYYKSYEELMSGDNALIDMGGIIQDPDPANDFTPVITGGYARANVFFTVFTEAYFIANGSVECDPDAVNATDTCAHWDVGNNQGWLTPDELRVISEWVDNGAQYVNNPFASPQN